MDDDTKKKGSDPGLDHIWSYKGMTPEQTQGIASRDRARRKGTGRKDWHLKYLEELKPKKGT